MEQKGLTASEAVKDSVNLETHRLALKSSHNSFALQTWGLGYKYVKTLANPIIEVEFDALQERLIADIMEKKAVRKKTAVFFFLLRALDPLGYNLPP